MVGEDVGPSSRVNYFFELACESKQPLRGASNARLSRYGQPLVRRGKISRFSGYKGTLSETNYTTVTRKRAISSQESKVPSFLARRYRETYNFIRRNYAA